MLNTLATEALYSATYVDNFIESVDNLPDDVQRLITRIHHIDVEFRGLLNEVDHFNDLVNALQTSESNIEARKSKRQRFLRRMHKSLIKAQELGDEKMHLVNQMQELIDNKSRQVDAVNDNIKIRDDVQQLHIQQMQYPQGDTALLATKHVRAQSPMLGEEVIGRNLATTPEGVGRVINSCGKESSFAAYNPTSLNISPVTDISPHTAINGINNEAARNNKRSRRRNDNANDYDALCMNEAGNNVGLLMGNDRPNSSRSVNISGQKKATGQNMTLMAANNSSIALSSGQAMGTANASGSNSAGKKKKRKAGGRQSSNQTQMQANAREDTPPLEAIDPDEPTYCVCNQISFGEMILCDNDLCPIEWFHFSCVSLVLKPKGKWYCPNCRGDRPNVMKPKAQFLKELERYNKEKEERTQV